MIAIEVRIELRTFLKRISFIPKSDTYFSLSCFEFSDTA